MRILAYGNEYFSENFRQKQTMLKIIFLETNWRFRQIGEKVKFMDIKKAEQSFQLEDLSDF